MAKISTKPWSDGQNFDHDHGQTANFPWSKWSTKKFYLEIQPQKYPFGP